MRTEDDGLSDEDSEAYLSDENANIDADSKQDCGALTDMGTEEDDVRSGTAAAVRQSLKWGAMHSYLISSVCLLLFSVLLIVPQVCISELINLDDVLLDLVIA